MLGKVYVKVKSSIVGRCLLDIRCEKTNDAGDC